MENKQFNFNKNLKNHSNEEKYELLIDYNNSYSFEKILKENNSRIYQLSSVNENYKYNVNQKYFQ